MNKKFSTLVASLLVSSTFGVYNVGAVPVLANQTQIETRAVAADVEEAVDYPDVIAAPNKTAGRILNGFTNNSLIAVSNGNDANLLCGVSTGNNVTFAEYTTNSADFARFYWRLEGGRLLNNAGQVFTIGTNSDYFEVIPLRINGEVSPYFVLGQREAGATGVLKYVGSNLTLVDDIASAYKLCSVETAYSEYYTGDELNEELGDGFTLTITSKVDPSAAIANADVFAGLLKAGENVAGSAFYTLSNANGFIVFDTNEAVTSDGHSEKGKFKTVKAAGNGQYNLFRIGKADNGSNDICIEMTNTTVSANYRLYIANAAGTYALTIAQSTDNALDWAATVLGSDNHVDLREFLTGQFYTVDFVKSMDDPVDADDEYKKGGRLAIRENGTTSYADYVDASSLYEKAPEAQWAVSATTAEDVNDGKPYFNNVITLTNRENPAVKVTIDALRRAEDGSGFVVVTGSSTGAPTDAGLCVNDVVRINVVADHDKHDGYEVFNDNDLRNETYHLGQIRQTADGDINVYWAENHAASHQIGATVEQANATRWNLSLVKKEVADHTNEIDSVLVVSELQEWNPVKNRIDAKKDTLVIFPYAFQNRSNSEFAEFNNGTNLEYYQCNVYGKDETKVYKYGVDAMFALKRKADINGERVYNYVMLPTRKTVKVEGEGENEKVTVTYNYKAGKHQVIPVDASSEKSWAEYKVYQENSTDRGTWKNMQMYAGDANALMFVTKVDAPEYRKLVTTAALDTIKLYRADNEAQVVYEKRDDKSVVDGRTLSFLNIDNDTQFTDINPALYADTAYVNRGNNTCWQYLLGVNIEHVDGYYCPTHGFAVTPPCEHAKPVSYNTGRYLINMIDTANVYGQTAGIHNNPYINETEEGMDCAKLSFVDAIHVLTDPMDETAADKLYVINGTEEGDTVAIDLSTPDFNIAKFAFKYMDSMNSDEFKIQTLHMPYEPTAYATGAANDPLKNTSEEGYLRWVNGCIVVDKTFQKGDVFNMDENETRTPTANEEISAEAGAVSVVATDGAIIVKGAEGKNVVVATILGKVVANEVATSDNETIAVPAGIAVVAVDGESFKVVVK